jgi:tetratricopeptide (TPR) repeat protein
VVGVFGVPSLHEDDALRGVRAALEMMAAIDRLNDDLAAPSGARLAIRVGVNTGEVAVSSGVALGHAISMAARLEQSAEPGQILIGEQTRALTQSTVEAEPVPSLNVKGSSTPLGAWSILRMLDADGGHVDPRSPFIGRKAETELIEAALGEAIRMRRCVVTTVVAPPGMGKTRLVGEMRAKLSAEILAVAGRCLPYGEGTPYAALAQIVEQLNFDPTVTLESELANQRDGAAVAGALHATITGSSPVSAAESAWAFRRLFESVAASRPMVVIIDDLHWADPMLLDVIDSIAATNTAPILLLCAARPDLFDLRPDWDVDRQVIRLDPLTSPETKALLDGVRHHIPRDLRDRIIDAADGIPLFVEQMAAFANELEAVPAVPPTIRAVLAARVDRLADDERIVLERGAVQGQIFRIDTVRALASTEELTSIDAALRALTRREFVRPDSPLDPSAFRFAHALVRDAVYESMPRRLRAQLHRQYGELLEADGSPPELTGHHFASAHGELIRLGETGSEVADLAVRAGRALHEAGRKSLARRETRRSVELLERSEVLLRAEETEWLLVVPTLITALVELPDFNAADALRDKALNVANRWDDETAALRIEIAWTFSGYARDLPGWYESASKLAEKAIDRLEAAGAHEDVVRALRVKGYAQSVMDAGALIASLQEAHRRADAIGDEAAQILLWDELGGAMVLGETPWDEVGRYIDEEIRWARERGIGFTEADGQLSLAYVQAGRGEFARARATLASIRDLLSALPAGMSHNGESFVLEGDLEQDAGNYGQSEQAYRHAVEVFSQNLPWKRWAITRLANLLIDVGRAAEARALLDQVNNEYPAPDTPIEKLIKLEAEARYAGALVDNATAVELARNASELTKSVRQPVVTGRVHETLAGLLAASGELDQARTEFERAHELFASKGYRPGEQRTVKALAVLADAARVA